MGTNRWVCTKATAAASFIISHFHKIFKTYPKQKIFARCGSPLLRVRAGGVAIRGTPSTAQRYMEKGPNYNRNLVSCEKKIRLQALDVLEKRTAYKRLHERQESRSNAKKTLSELSKWRKQFDMRRLPESTLRGPDRMFPVRIYTKIDDETWKLPEVRGWFQRYAIEQRDQGVNLEKTNYLVRDTPANWSAAVPAAPSPKSRVDQRKSNFSVKDGSLESYDPLTAGYLMPKAYNLISRRFDLRNPLLPKKQENQWTTDDRWTAMEESGYLIPRHQAHRLPELTMLAH